MEGRVDGVSGELPCKDSVRAATYMRLMLRILPLPLQDLFARPRPGLILAALALRWRSVRASLRSPNSGWRQVPARQQLASWRICLDIEH